VQREGGGGSPDFDDSLRHVMDDNPGLELSDEDISNLREDFDSEFDTEPYDEEVSDDDPFFGTENSPDSFVVPEGVDKYTADVISSSKRATAAGIRSFSDRRVVDDIARSAADVINSVGRSGYTVYGSDTQHLSDDGQESLGTFPMVGYGSGETRNSIKRMVNILQDHGYKTVIGPESYGIIVGTQNSNLVEEYWAGQPTKKEYSLRLKGGAGSGHFGHKGRPGEQGGSLPKGESASGRQTTKLNRREVYNPNDKPGDLSGIRTRIPNADGELSHGAKLTPYKKLYSDDADNVAENKRLLQNYAQGEENEMGLRERMLQDSYEAVLDDIANQLLTISEKIDTPTAALLIRDYAKVNGYNFTKRIRDDLAAMLSYSGID
jgi:hypothetical protein